MEVTGKQAQEVLQDVDSVARSVQGKLAYGIAGPILVLWGAVWMVCFSISHFLPEVSGWAWVAGNGLGIGGSLYLGRFRAKARSVRSESARRLGWKLFWFWFLLFVYGDIWLVVLWPWRPDQFGMFIVTLIMFAYVVMGLWLDEMRFMLWLGLAVTVLAGAGYALSFLVPGYLELWLGLAGGSALLVSGLYLTIRWR
jgi:hypothetical protein